MELQILFSKEISMSKKINSKDVEIFLLDNLDFFESRESLVSEMKFKDSRSSASSLLERQILKLRDEQKNLIDLLNSFISTAKDNEDLFVKSKNLTLRILESETREEVVNKVESSFREDFGVDVCILKFLENNDIQKLEKEIDLSLHKKAIYCGSFSEEKTGKLFEEDNIQSLVVAVIIVKNKIGLLKLGSFDRTKYLGDEDTTFIEYIVEVLEKKLN